MARPRSVDAVEVLRLRLAGASWREIAAKTGLGLGTVFRAHRTALDSLAAFQNRRTKYNRDYQDTSFLAVLALTKQGCGANVEGMAEEFRPITRVSV